MDVTLMYFDGCPNWIETRETIRDALRELERPEQAVTLQRVETPEEADRLAFHGSPTVLVNGQDLFADPTAGVGLMCRVYRTETGFAGSPTRDELVEALRSRIQRVVLDAAELPVSPGRDPSERREPGSAAPTILGAMAPGDTGGLERLAHQRCQ